MFLASGGPPELTLTIVVLGGGAMASAGANALNQFLDRDIDARMHRTSDRPVATNRVHPREALLFGAGLNVVAFVLFITLVNPLSALLTLTATLFYVFVYTMALKRTTPQNIVIGGAAGALPPMIGWTAVTGSLGLPAIYLFAIIFFWTPPHFWALSLLLKDDYARARVPMLPVVAGVTQTKRSIFLYTLMLLALTSMFFTTEAVGWIYFAASLILGLLFIYYAWRLLKRPGIEGAVGTYVYSLVYLALLFTAIMVDGSLGG
jgi:protoheme IX farnesyltransferase